MREQAPFFTRSPPEDPGPFYEKIDRAVHGLREFSLIYAAVELGIFDHCIIPMTVEDLSSSSCSDLSMCRLLCEALVAEGLLARKNNQFINTPMSSTYLAGDSPYSQVHYIGQLARMGQDMWISLAQIMRNGPVQYNRDDFFREFSLPAMAENALSGRLQAVVQAIIHLPGFSRMRRVLDLGGGHGLYAIAIAMQQSDIEAWVFDLPHVIPLAGRYVEHYRCQNVHLVPGDFFCSPIGGGYDLIISSSNPSGKSIKMLPKISDALNEGGYFVNVQSPGGLPLDPLQSLEWNLWTFSGVNKLQEGCTKEQVFMTPAYRKALSENGLFIIDEQDIRDDYRYDTWVTMVIAQKRTGKTL